MKAFINWAITALIIFIVASLLRGVHIENLWTAFVLSFVMALLNMFVRPLLVLLTFPITIVTFGLFLLVINAGMVLLASTFVKGFSVDGFWWALLFSIFVSLGKMLLLKERY